MSFHLRGLVLPDDDIRDVFVTDDGRISFRPLNGAQNLLEAGFLLPGLVDCHTHLALFSPAPSGASASDQVRASALAELDAGVMALREPGSPNRLSAGLGPQVGLPRIFTAGRLLAPNGGYFPGLAIEVDDATVTEAAVKEVSASSGWAKLIGDFFGPDGRLSPNYHPATLVEVAASVHAAAGRVAIHATLPETIASAIAAGFDSIEHGTFMDPDLIPRMQERAVTWVPTLIISEEIEYLLQDSPDGDRLTKQLDALPQAVRLAVNSGVRVLAGTDAGMVPHGQIVSEVEHLLRAGLTPTQALAAASWEARTFLGLPGIEEGAPADLLAYAADPRANPDHLRHPVVRIFNGKLL